jgi:hypothetical protein
MLESNLRRQEHPRKRRQHDTDTKSHRVNLTKKRKAENGQWQFYPVQWDGNKPDPRLIIDEEPDSWKGEEKIAALGGRKLTPEKRSFSEVRSPAWRLA